MTSEEGLAPCLAARQCGQHWGGRCGTQPPPDVHPGPGNHRQWPGVVFSRAILATVFVAGYGFVWYALARAKAPPKPAAPQPGQSRRKSPGSRLRGVL